MLETQHDLNSLILFSNNIKSLCTYVYSGEKCMNNCTEENKFQL